MNTRSLLIVGLSLLAASTAGMMTVCYAKPVHKPVDKQEVQKQNLQRADLRIGGTSCAACLMRVEDKLNKTPGVIKAAVSVFSPYTTIIIFDSSKTDLTKIHGSLSGEPVKFENVTEQKVDKVPAVLLPPAKLEGMQVH